MRQTFARYGSGLLVASIIMVALVRPAEAADGRFRSLSRTRQVTHASWYGNEFRGRPTASGSRFDPRRLTAAHRTLRLGTKVRVTALSTGKSVVVEITDRGPYVKGRGIDLSHAAARSLGMVNQGVARVAIEVVPTETAAAATTPVIMAANSPTIWWLPKAIVQ